MVTLNSRVPVNTPGIAALRLLGMNGDDTFNVTGSATGLAFTTLLDGGNPPASDVVNLAGNGTAAIAAQIGNADGTAVISGGGLGTISLTGDEIANITAANPDLNVTATSAADVMVVTPALADSATLRANNVSPTVNASGIGTLNVNLASGSDQLVVNGTQGNDTITVTGALVNEHVTFETVNYTNTEDLSVNGLAGNDIFDVSPSATTTMFIDGGDPIGSTPGDSSC
jgi:hypothetical protein